MKIFMFFLMLVVSAAVTAMFVYADSTNAAAIWGVTTGIWAGNLINALMEES